jgi:thiol-disulfide isomerase/thioredoxin
MSRRNTYLLGGAAAVAGIVMLVIAITALNSDGDDSTPGSERGAREAPTTDAPAPAPDAGGEAGGGEGERSAGSDARGAGIGQDLARRRPVRAPDLSAEVIHDGSIPSALEGPFRRASGGGTLDITELRGTPVVLFLWGTQCAPCRADTRLVEATWKRWGPRGVLFVGVNVNEPAAAAEAVIRQYDLTYPAVLDRQGQIAARYGATALPQTFFVSAGGDIVGQVVGGPSVRQLEVGTAAARSGEPFGSEQGSSRVPLR